MLLYHYLKFFKMACIVGLFVATGVLFWPGALAAVTGFSILGLSLGMLAGASLLYQVAAVAVATFLALHLAAIVIDLIATLVTSIFKRLTAPSQPQADEQPKNEPHPPKEEQPGVNPYQPKNGPQPPPNDPGKNDQPPTYDSLYPKIQPVANPYYVMPPANSNPANVAQRENYQPPQYPNVAYPLLFPPQAQPSNPNPVAKRSNYDDYLKAFDSNTTHFSLNPN